MKKDVIFLGAGASVDAGFPTNEALTRYVIYDLVERPQRERFRDARGNLPIKTHDHATKLKWQRVLMDWKAAGESLRRSKLLSIDEYCQLSTPPGHAQQVDTVIQLKRMLRAALMDHAEKWNQWNSYSRLISDLFQGSEHLLNDRFTVINFNYDGLFGKLLVDAVRERHRLRGIQPPAPERLASLAGGYLPDSGMKAIRAEEPNSRLFNHFMPHGTITTFRSHTNLINFQDVLYAETFGSSDMRNRDEMEAWFYTHWYESMPLIHFPWESEACDPVFARQLEVAAIAVEQADRVHFVGVSGHSLLGHTLQKLFHVGPQGWSSSEAETGLQELAKKEWHMATLDRSPKMVWANLVRCILPRREDREAFMQVNRTREDCPSVSINMASHIVRRTNVFFYQGFEEWLKEKPHLA